ncbi:hypothetical protein WICMUC_003482 [Wickerhamomyces mucosus]|uniref:Spindle pole body component SPC42 n=1 Tax=Wickerhamomyces mucosus TaxID=1378264 RepID=A0A9P8PM63_9ASCO|nr:hypothetical protein WICMUC_003482 [Wickerhamomyces mucosus]
MDYSPTPSSTHFNKVKPQYSFLDNSIEIPRSIKPSLSTFSSPIIKKDRDENLQQRQRQFFNKYQDLNISPLKQVSKSKKNLNKIPIDDDFKINSNMIDKIIKENESLKRQIKSIKRENEMVINFANGLKEKLVKYKKLNDELKNGKINHNDKDELKNGEINNDEDKDELKFNPNDSKDIFNDEREKLENDLISNRINQLESNFLQNNNQQFENLNQIKIEIEKLKQLQDHNDINKNLITDDDLIIYETNELKNLEIQIEEISKKLTIREENKLKKLDLNNKLNELKLKLIEDDNPVKIKDKVKLSDICGNNNNQDLNKTKIEDVTWIQ